MPETIQKLKDAHDSIMRITLNAQDAVTFSQGILLLREAISELERGKDETEE